MNPEQENFQELRRLLALKRYEQPPPGYFNSFSQQVIARIQAGEAKTSWLDRVLGETTWLQQLWGNFGAKPALAGAFGLAICGTLVAGAIWSDDTNPPAIALVAPQVPTTQTQGAVSPEPGGQSTERGLLTGFSPDGVLPQATPSIFQEMKQAQARPLFQRVEQSYVITGGN